MARLPLGSRSLGPPIASYVHEWGKTPDTTNWSNMGTATYNVACNTNGQSGTAANPDILKLPDSAFDYEIQKTGSVLICTYYAAGWCNSQTNGTNVCLGFDNEFDTNGQDGWMFNYGIQNSWGMRRTAHYQHNRNKGTTVELSLGMGNWGHDYHCGWSTYYLYNTIEVTEHEPL